MNSIINNKLKKDIYLICGDSLEILKKIPDNSINMIFADPPYNLSGDNNVTLYNGRIAICNKGYWDKFSDLDHYLQFTYQWTKECYRILRFDGTIWITGTFHCHPVIGFLLKRIGYWIINDIIWYKPNAPPLLKKNRCRPSTELIWLASKNKNYYFNYEIGKEINNSLDLDNLWVLKAQKHKTNHPTEKPEELLRRIILLGSKHNHIILDPFMGSGTTGVVAKHLNRKFIGIEKDRNFYIISRKRIFGSHCYIG